MPGPPPSENPAHRGVRVGPVRLPSAGRKGPPPRWPLEGFSDAEQELWTELWALPQATEWARLKYGRIVARYCRLALESENERTKDVLSHILALEDRLGLTPKAMRALLWTIAVDEVAGKREERETTSARGRLKAVG